MFRLRGKRYSAPYLSYHTSCLPLHRLLMHCTAAILPSNAKRLFPIIMPFNAIRMVIRLQMKYLYDTVVWVYWCGEFRKAVGREFRRTERLRPNLGLICKPSLLPLLLWTLKGRRGCMRDSCGQFFFLQRTSC